MMLGSSWALTASRLVHSSAPPFGPDDLLGRHVQQHRAEQRLRDAHAAQDEVLPGRLQAGRRAVDADQQHGGQRRGLHRHPDDAHVVGGQRQQHREAEQLVHAVVQAHARRRHLAVVALDAHVGSREDRRGQADEGRQRDEEDVQRVDVELACPRPAVGPPSMICTVRKHAAMKVPELKTTLTSRARSRWPTRPSTSPPEQRDREQEGERDQLSLPSAFRGCGCPGCRTARGSGT